MDDGSKWAPKVGRGKKRGPKYKHPSTKASREFGMALEQLMVHWGYDPTDPEDQEARDLFLEALRKNQDPPRRVSYAPCVLDAWLSGALLPRDAELDACMRLSRAADDGPLENMLDACADNDGIRKGVAKNAFSEIALALDIPKIGIIEERKGATLNGPSLLSLVQQELRNDANDGHGSEWLAGILAGKSRLPEEVHKALKHVIGAAPVAQDKKEQALHALEDARSASASTTTLNVGRATEFSILFKHCIEHSGISERGLVKKLWDDFRIGGVGKALTIDDPDAALLTHNPINNWIHGITIPPPFAVRALKDIFSKIPAVAEDAHLLPYVYDDRLQQQAEAIRAQAETITQDGETKLQPGLLLKACRARFGQSQAEFSLGWDPDPKKARIQWGNYENGSNIRDPDRREKIRDHTLMATARAAETYTAQLGILPEPWLLDKEEHGLAPSTAMPLNLTVQKAAEKRLAELNGKFVKNEKLSIDRKGQAAASRERASDGTWRG